MIINSWDFKNYIDGFNLPDVILIDYSVNHIVNYSVVILDSQFVSTSTIGIHFILVPNSFLFNTSMISICFDSFPCFLLLQNISGLSYTFPVPVLK